MNSQQVIKTLKTGQPAPVYLIVGTEAYLREQLKKAFLELIPTAEQTMNFGTYDMESTPVAVALDDAMSAPFFGERRLVFINHPYFLTGERQTAKVDHDLDGLLAYLKQPEPTTVLVILADYPKLDARKKLVKTLKKTAVTVEIEQISEKETRGYVQSALDAAAVKIDDDAFQQLMLRTDGQLGTVMNELPKLILYAHDTQQITADAVNQLVSRSLSQNVFDLVNDVLTYRTQAALELYQELLAAKEVPLRINAVLLGQFRLLLQAKILGQAGHSQGNIAGALKVHPYRVKLALQSVRRFSTHDLRAAYLGLLNTEQQMKTTQRDPQLLFELFLVRYVNTRKAEQHR